MIHPLQVLLCIVLLDVLTVFVTTLLFFVYGFLQFSCFKIALSIQCSAELSKFIVDIIGILWFINQGW